VPCGDRDAIYKEFRSGDVRHSHANIDKAVSLLGYEPEFTLAAGLGLTVAGFVAAED
jgi:UDP-N-acetylglucosamine 4-epimerase